MSETARARAWIYTRLANDPTMQGLVGQRVYHGVAPAGTQFPYVVFQLLSPGNDLLVVGGARVWAEPLYLVKAVVKGTSTGQIEPVADRIDALLHAQSGTVTNGVIWAATRERPHEQPELTDGVMYQNLGGEYRLLASMA
jgi:hypothetical protein